MPVNGSITAALTKSHFMQNPCTISGDVSKGRRSLKQSVSFDKAKQVQKRERGAEGKKSYTKSVNNKINVPALVCFAGNINQPSIHIQEGNVCITWVFNSLSSLVRLFPSGKIQQSQQCWYWLPNLRLIEANPLKKNQCDIPPFSTHTGPMLLTSCYIHNRSPQI